MVAKKPASRKSATLKEAVKASSPPEFVLSDYRVVNMTSERYLPNERAARGTYQVSTDTGNVTVPGEGDAPVGSIVYSVGLAGFKKSDHEGGADEKSFLVKIQIEGKFTVYNCLVPTKEDIEKLLPPIVQQLHVLAIDKIRSGVAELGYHGVRPSLGVKNVRTIVD